jgi:hypothetical protein
VLRLPFARPWRAAAPAFRGRAGMLSGMGWLAGITGEQMLPAGSDVGLIRKPARSPAASYPLLPTAGPPHPRGHGRGNTGPGPTPGPGSPHTDRKDPMPSRAARLTARTAGQITALLADRRKTAAAAAAAAALAGTGAGLAATVSSPASHPAATRTTTTTRTAAGSTAGTGVRASSTASPARDTARTLQHTTSGSRHSRRAGPAALPRHRAPARPYLMYDSTTPAAIPAHHQIATYANGSYAVPASQVTGRTVMWIDTNGSDPRAAALDVEPGDATPATAANWARAKLTEQPNSLAHIYTMLSDWGAVKTDIAALPPHMQTHIRYWIADPTGTPHLVPGSQATQWYWGPHYDISTVAPTFQ